MSNTKLHTTGKVNKDNATTNFASTAFGFAPAALSDLTLECSINDNSNTITAVTVTDNLGGVWTIKPSAKSAGGNFAFVAYRLDIPAGITSFTVAFTGAGTCFCVYSLDEWDEIGAFQATNSAVGASHPTGLATGSISVNNGDLVLTVWGSDDNNATATWTGTGTGGLWTIGHSEVDTNSHHASYSAFQVVSGAPGTLNPAMDYSVETAVAAAAIVSFRIAGGGGGPASGAMAGQGAFGNSAVR